MTNLGIQTSVRDVSTRATGATPVAPKIFRYLNPIPTRGADSAHHQRGCTYNFAVVTSLSVQLLLVTTDQKCTHVSQKIIKYAVK